MRNSSLDEASSRKALVRDQSAGAPATAESGQVGFCLTEKLGLSPSDVVSAGSLIEQLEYSHIFVNEANRDSTVTACSLLAGTSRVIVATGVANARLRQPELLRDAARTLSQLGGRRFILGVGAGHPETAPRNAGLYTESSVDLGTYVQRIKAGAGQGGSDVNAPFPLVVAALGRAGVRRAARIASGALLNLCTPSWAFNLCEALQGQSGAELDEFIVYCYLHVLAVPTGVPSLPVGEARDLVSRYLNRRHYRNSLRRQGFAAEIDRFERAANAADRQAALSEELITQLVIPGTSADVGRAVRSFRQAGVDVPIIYPHGLRPGMESLQEFLSELSPRQLSQHSRDEEIER